MHISVNQCTTVWHHHFAGECLCLAMQCFHGWYPSYKLVDGYGRSLIRLHWSRAIFAVSNRVTIPGSGGFLAMTLLNVRYRPCRPRHIDYVVRIDRWANCYKIQDKSYELTRILSLELSHCYSQEDATAWLHKRSTSTSKIIPRLLAAGCDWMRELYDTLLCSSSPAKMLYNYAKN